MKKLPFFTLAEVLITLGIIAIVAAMTIPTLMQNSQEAQMKAGVKVAYSILSQAMTQARTDNGGTITGAFNGQVSFKNLFKQYLQYTKDCDDNVVTNGCWITQQYMDGTPWTNYSSTGLVLNNGMLIYFRSNGTDCSYSNAYSDNWKCGYIEVDVNGFKGPNKLGKDTFTFSVQDGTIKPFGISGDNGNVGTCNSTDTGFQSGWGCTYKYLYGQ